MKKYALLFVLLLSGFAALSCPVCDQKQPAVLRGIAHGAGPESNWDYLIISVVGVIVLVTLFFSVKWLIRPGEKSDTHIKRAIING
jgi:uncharacterized protein HemY